MKTSLRFSVLLLSILVLSFCDAGAQWVSSTGSFGYTIYCLAVIPNGAGGTSLFAGTASGGVFLSTDSGTSWTAANSGLPANCQVGFFAVNGTNLFALTDNGVFRSTNSGTSWVALDSEYTNGISSFAFIGTNIFAGSFNGGIYISKDNGTSWTIDTTGFPKDSSGYLLVPNALAASGTNLFAGTGMVLHGNDEGGVFLSTDNGTSWSAIGLTNTFVNHLVVCPNGKGDTNLIATTMFPSGGYFAGHVFLSTDNGTSWAEIDSGLTNTWIMSLSAIPNGSGGTSLFVGTGGDGVFISTNTGGSWKPAGLSNTSITALAVSPSGTGGTNIFAGDFGGSTVPGESSGNIFLSTDSGTTWTTTILNATVNALALSPNGAGGTTLFAIASSVFLSSTNNGTSWKAAGLPQPTWFTALAVSPISGGTGGTNIFTGGDCKDVFLSTDNGTSWTAALDSGLAKDYVNFLAVTPNGAGDIILFAGINNSGVFRSMNYGTSWTPVPGLPSSTVTSFIINGANQFFGTNGGGVFLSTDDGISWGAVNTGLKNLNVNALAVIDTNLFAGTNGNGVFLTTNDGASWTAAGLKGMDVCAFAVIDTNLFAGTSTGGVYLSTDNGAHWSSVNTGLANTAINAFVQNGKDIFAGTGSGIWRRPLSEMITGIKGGTQSPLSFALLQNYPNPFNPTTTISYQLAAVRHVTLKIYDVLGREVATLVNEVVKPGRHEARFSAEGGSASGGDGSQLASGVYFCRFQAGNYTEIKKLVLLK